MSHIENTTAFVYNNVTGFPWIFEITHYAYKNDGKDIGDVLSIVGDSWNLISVKCDVNSILLRFVVTDNLTRRALLCSFSCFVIRRKQSLMRKFMDWRHQLYCREN